MYPGTNQTWTQDKGSPGKKSGREGGEGAKDYSLSIYSSLLKVRLHPNLPLLWLKSLVLLIMLTSLLNLQNEILGSSIEDFKEASEERRAMAPLPEGRNLFSYRWINFFTWDLSQIWLKPDYNSQLYPLLNQAEEAQYCQWTTVAIQSQSCVFQKSKAAQVIHSFRFLCWTSLTTTCFIALGAQGKLRARSQKYLSKSSMRPSCKMTFTSIW